MNWIRNNKFLAGFFAVIAVGVLGIGYFLYAAHDSYSEVSDAYNAQATELLRLQSLIPYPDEQNLKKYREQKDIFAAGVADLQRDLAAENLPIEPTTPQQFQDELKLSVASFAGRAAAGGVKLPPPESFYLGFEAYRNAPPKPEAAAPLDSQLKAVEIVMNELLDSRVVSVDSLTRTPLPEEQPSKPGAKSSSLVSYFPFNLTFTCGPKEFVRFLNRLVGEKQQFFVVRSVQIKNSNEKSPPRVLEPPGQTLPPSSAVSSQPGASSEKPRFQFVFGTETITVALRIDIVRFAPPGSTPST